MSTLPFDDDAHRKTEPSRVVDPLKRIPTTPDEARELARAWIAEIVRLEHQQREGTITGRAAQLRRREIDSALQGLRLYRNVGEKCVVQPKDAVRSGDEAPKPNRIGDLRSVEFSGSVVRWRPHVVLPCGRNSRRTDVVLLSDV